MQISYIQIEVPGIKRSLLCFLFEIWNLMQHRNTEKNDQQ